MAILSNPTGADGLILTPLVVEDVHMVRSKLARTICHRTPVIDDFVGLQFTTTAYFINKAEPVIADLFHEHGVTVTKPVIINSIPMTREVLLDGIGFCVGPPSNFGPELAAGDLVSLPVPGLCVVRSLAVRDDRVVSRTFVELKRFVRDKINALVADGTWPYARLPETQEV